MKGEGVSGKVGCVSGKVGCVSTKVGCVIERLSCKCKCEIVFLCV